MSGKQSKQPWQRVGVFLDSQNLFYTAKYLYKARVNFNTLLEDVVGDRRLVRAIAYVIKTEDGDESSFFDALEKIGFDVKAKPLQIFYGGNKKGDWDIGIAMDIVRMAQKLDVVILLSGDGDFVDLIEYAKASGCRTEAAAFGRSSSSKLKEEVDEFIDLDGNDRYLLQKGRVRLPSDYRKSTNDATSSDTQDSNATPSKDDANTSEQKIEKDTPKKPVVESLSEKVKIVRGGSKVKSAPSARKSASAAKKPSVTKKRVSRAKTLSTKTSSAKTKEKPSKKRTV